MNQLIAVLRDSYRESVSARVVPVMLGLSLLVILFLASISFHQITLREDLENSLGQLNFVNQFMPHKNPEMGTPRFVIQNMVASNEAEPWKSDYSFDLALVGGDPTLFDQLKSTNEYPVNAVRAKRFISAIAPYLKEIKTEERDDRVAPAVLIGGVTPFGLAAEGRGELRIHVETTGVKVDSRESWMHQPKVLFAFKYFYTYSLRDGVYMIEKWIVGVGFSWLILLIGVVAAASYIPNMQQKGTLDLLVSKPIGRSRLLAFKFIGGLILVFLLTGVLVLGSWVVIGLRTGIWAPQLLLVVPFVTFYFANLYAVSTLVAVATRSVLASILATLFAWALFFGIGYGHYMIVKTKEAERDVKLKIAEAKKQTGESVDPDSIELPLDRKGVVPKTLEILSVVLYTPCPRTYDVDNMMISNIVSGVLSDFEIKQRQLDRPQPPPWYETIGVSSLFIVVCLVLSCWRFSTRDG